MKRRHRVEIVEKKKRLLVRITLVDGTRIFAERNHEGRIIYDDPQRVPRDLKHIVVPDKFKEIDEREFGIKRA